MIHVCRVDLHVALTTDENASELASQWRSVPRNARISYQYGQIPANSSHTTSTNLCSYT